MLLESKIGETTVSKMECILEYMFYRLWLHFGGHFGAKNLPKSMPKLDEKNGCDFGCHFGGFGELLGGPAEVARPVGPRISLVLG